MTPGAEDPPAARGRRAAFAAAGVVALVLLQQAVYRGAYSPRERSDYPVYEAAGRAFTQGADVYAVVSDRGWAFNGLPVLAAAFAPFAAWPRALGLAVYTLLSLALFAAAARSWARLFPTERRDAALGGFLVAAAFPLVSAVARGQPSVAGLSLALLGLAAHAAGRPLASGVGLALATATKLFPAGWAALLVPLGGARSAAYAAVFGVALLLLPATVRGGEWNLAALRRCREASTPPAAKADADPLRYAHTLDPRIGRNQSLEAVLLRNLCDDGELDRGDGRVPYVRYGARALALAWLGAAVALARRTARSGRRAEAVALLTTPLIAACPVAWSHYYLGAAATGAVAGALRRDPRAGRFAAAALVAGAAGPLLGTVLPALKILGVTAGGAAAAWAFLAVALERSGGASPPAERVKTAA